MLDGRKVKGDTRRPTIEGSLPIWFSLAPKGISVETAEGRRLIDELQPIKVQELSYDDRDNCEIRYLFSNNCSQYEGDFPDQEDLVLRNEQIVLGKDAEYKVWAVEIKEAETDFWEIVFWLTEKTGALPGQKKLRVTISKESVFGYEFLAWQNSDLMSLMKSLAFVQSSASSTREVMLMTWTAGEGCKVEKYFPDLEIPHWLSAMEQLGYNGRFDTSKAWRL